MAGLWNWESDGRIVVLGIEGDGFAGSSLGASPILLVETGLCSFGGLESGL